MGRTGWWHLQHSLAEIFKENPVDSPGHLCEPAKPVCFLLVSRPMSVWRRILGLHQW